MTTTISASAVSRDQDGDVHDNNDPAARPTRRTFSTEEKLAHLSAHELCDPGTKGEFARREGIHLEETDPKMHLSFISDWQRACCALPARAFMINESFFRGPGL